MNKWSLKQARIIDDCLADFIYKRFTTGIGIIINDKDLYKAIIYLNKMDTEAFVAVIKSDSDKNYLLVRCNSERYEEVTNRIQAMYQHYNEIMSTIKSSE